MTCKAVIQKLRRLVVRDSGQDLMEYGLLMCLIAIVAISAVTTVGQTINSVFWEFIVANKF